ncbi:MAG: hypothetical protein PWQ15_739 [Methanobacterium sp.]|uniref:hypothetical protein n=1 Tax=Methanobacterium sp. TaxID=2164 RepID=UPI0003C9B5FC|nr:hypothetical protein [Methanobacterium sp.]MDI3549637.1 hypothetical protein [Methanobacterium sp.]MDI6644984.1 hypothetical protein [Methanobacteriaceae archaeon]MDI6882657.1 hypothetical protein [Methanothermobacter sp.]CDG65233.1 hypothetical protein MBMB1_1132 [Methanobacterium sp. MB1]
MNLIRSYNDLKFAIRCVDVWKKLQPTSDELAEALKYHNQRSNLKTEDTSKLTCICLQDYLEMMIDVIQEETGPWFFYVDIAGALFDQVEDQKIFIYQTDNGYCVIFPK